MNGGHPRTQVQRRQVVAHLAWEHTYHGCMAYSEAAAFVGTPALGQGVIRFDTRRFIADPQIRDLSGEGARDAIPRIALIACAGSRSIRIRARGIHIASTIVRLAFVDVRARDAVTRIARIACARVRSWRIRARCIHVASAVVRLAFIDIRARREAVAGIPRVADARAIRARSVRYAFGARAARSGRAHACAIANIGAGTFTVRVHVALDV